ncbi:Uncharacterized protein TCM_007660 [Theobroma cacao]|uniref:Replication protein A OB domain-containing protein n=1 Tax=Theobroma cacao TaxID=3641 RepID=A0A061E317_THECC|nr:Uncharacterized protein TCM_007660 [Theobroma cacao]
MICRWGLELLSFSLACRNFIFGREKAFIYRSCERTKTPESFHEFLFSLALVEMCETVQEFVRRLSTTEAYVFHIWKGSCSERCIIIAFEDQYNIPLNLGGPRYVCCFCGAQMWYEERKNKSRNERNPRFTMCCMEGKVSLPPFKQTPSLLATLLNYKGGRTAYKFRHNKRVYNSMFQFTSIGGKIDSEINRRPGPYVFKINGQNHHKIGSLLPVDGERPKFAQLYIYDTENEVSNRINALGYDVQQSGVEENIVKELMEMLDQTNQIVKAFRMAKERFKEPDYIPVKLRLIGARMNDGQQYTNLISSEVAALIVGDVDQLIDKRDIIIEHRSNALKFIDGQRVEDRPDIVCRVFKIRLRCFIKELVDDQHFGKVRADIIDLIISMSKVTAIYVSNKSTKVPKRNLQLQNIKGTIINATLWGDLAYCVDDDIIGLKSKPIIILAAMTVGEYQDMKARFDEKNALVLLLDVRQQPQIPPDQQENHNRVTIKQLLQIDHSKTQIETYTCIAKIKEFDCTEGCYFICVIPNVTTNALETAKAALEELFYHIITMIYVAHLILPSTVPRMRRIECGIVTRILPSDYGFIEVTGKFRLAAAK